MSIAPGWVRVKKSRTGLFGPTLYNVRDVQKTYETAEALALLFPDSLLPPGFTDPVLSAFANAILHCANCGEVAIILNGAIEQAESKIKKADSKIVDDYAAFLGETTIRVDCFYDVNVLPHPKEAIIAAIEREIVRSPLEGYVDSLRTSAAWLWNFLEGIGPEPIPFIALKGNAPGDPNELRRILASPKYKRDEKKSSRLWAVAEAENKKVEERLAAAVRIRSTWLAH